MTRTRLGFTLVELLIVIVVIAILAAITIVAYNGVQQRANNTSIKSQASAVAKLFKLYKTGEDAYPITATVCGTQDDDCRTYNGGVINDSSYRPTFLNAIKKYGTLPASVPHPDGTYYGLNIATNANFTLDSQPAPILMTFFLYGTKQDCTGIGSMISVADDPKGDGTINMKKQSYSNQNVAGSGVTRCYEMFPPV